jgi:hypothetical protein
MYGYELLTPVQQYFQHHASTICLSPFYLPEAMQLEAYAVETLLPSCYVTESTISRGVGNMQIHLDLGPLMILAALALSLKSLPSYDRQTVS